MKYFALLLFSYSLQAGLITDKNFRDLNSDSHKEAARVSPKFITSNNMELMMKAGRCLRYLSEQQVINEIHQDINTPALIYLGFYRGRKVIYLQDFKDRSIKYWNLWSDTKPYYYTLKSAEAEYHVIYNGFRLYVLNKDEMEGIPGLMDYLKTDIHKSSATFKELKKINEDYIASLFHWIRTKSEGAQAEIDIYKKLSGAQTLGINLSYKKKLLLCKELMGPNTELGKLFQNAIARISK
ncbi:MAG: hypothetical protein EP326_12220 [Deltaproteobacteria bacterium]|nr:MAG: hypothetical protein EP326_12220 [Deltaproteobacteria bacterium]